MMSVILWGQQLLISNGVLLYIIVGLLSLRYLQWRKHSKNLPFPMATPFPFNQSILMELIYISMHIFFFHGGNPPLYLKSLRKRFGDVFFLGPLSSFPKTCPCLVVLHPDDQSAILRKESSLEWFVNMPNNITAIHGKNNLQVISGSKHGSLRKIYSSILSPKSLKRFTEIIISRFQAMWNELEQMGEPVKIQSFIRDTQLQIMCEILFGFGNKTKEEKKILQDFSHDFHLTEKALKDFIQIKDFKNGVKAKERIEKVLYERFDSIFDDRISASEQNKDYEVGSAMEQIVDGLIRAKCEDKTSDVYKLARENLYLLLEASHSTTMTVTTSMMYFLNRSDNRNCLERLRKEVKSLEPTYESIKQFSFGTACVKETMRLAPIVGSISYYISEGKSFVIKGQKIDGPIIINFHSSNWYEDNAVFENADSFQPQRWLGSISRFAKSTFHPFGFGRHICLGAPLANLVMNANLYSFVSNQRRSIVYNEEKVKIVSAIFPEKSVSDEFVGKVVVSKATQIDGPVGALVMERE